MSDIGITWDDNGQKARLVKQRGNDIEGVYDEDLAAALKALPPARALAIMGEGSAIFTAVIREVGELLAVVHHDGGHYMTKYGFSPALVAARELVVRERADLHDQIDLWRQLLENASPDGAPFNGGFSAQGGELLPCYGFRVTRGPLQLTEGDGGELHQLVYDEDTGSGELQLVGYLAEQSSEALFRAFIGTLEGERDTCRSALGLLQTTVDQLRSEQARIQDAWERWMRGDLDTEEFSGMFAERALQPELMVVNTIHPIWSLFDTDGAFAAAWVASIKGKRVALDAPPGLSEDLVERIVTAIGSVATFEIYHAPDDDSEACSDQPLGFRRVHYVKGYGFVWAEPAKESP